MSMIYNAKVVNIDGKPYIELPCFPGTTVYYVRSKFDDDRSVEYVIEPKILETLTDIFFYSDSIGKDMFFTMEEAEEYKRAFMAKRESILN